MSMVLVLIVKLNKLKDCLKKPMNGDSDKMAEAQDVMAKLAIEKERLRIQKARAEQDVNNQQEKEFKDNKHLK